MGDLNCDMIATRYDDNTKRLVIIADVYGLHQLITQPTRITPTSKTSIDLIYTNCPNKIMCSGVCHSSISDHSTVYVHQKQSGTGVLKGHNTITYRNLENYIRDNFRNDIMSQNWPHMYIIQIILMICCRNGNVHSYPLLLH